MNSDQLIRQSDLIPEEVLGQKITVVGAGAIGSFVVLSLAKMGFRNIIVYDFDRVSDENMSNQWFRLSDKGQPKVTALQDLIQQFTGTLIHPIDERWDKEFPLKGIVISSVDNMATRREIWEAAKETEAVTCVIDPRMAAEYALSFVMCPHLAKDVTSYEKTLYSDETAVSEPCTAKATMYTATMIAGYVAKHVKDIVTGQPYVRITNWNIKTNVLQGWNMRGELLGSTRTE